MAAVLVALSPGAVLAQDQTVAVKLNETKTLVTLKAKGADGPTPAAGKVAYQRSTISDSYDLAYTAPAALPANKADEVAYRDDAGAARKVPIRLVDPTGDTALRPKESKTLATDLLAADSVKSVDVGRAEIRMGASKTLELVYTAPDVISKPSATVTYLERGTVTTTSVPLSNQPRNDASRPDDGKSTSLIGTNLNGSAFGPTAFKALLVIFVMATLLESGLAVLFHWSPFLQYFNPKGITPVISTIFAFIFVKAFDLDILAKMVEIMWEPAKTDIGSQFISALILAGGSKTVNNILVTLGWRTLIPDHPETPKPPKNDAWISVSVIKKSGTTPGPVEVWLSPGAEQRPSGLAAIIDGKRTLTPFMRIFLRDPSRFPSSGGHAVVPGTSYVIRIVESGKPSAALEMIFTPAPGAIIDFVADLSKSVPPSP